MEDTTNKLFTKHGSEGLKFLNEDGISVVQESIQVHMSQQQRMSLVREVIINQF